METAAGRLILLAAFFGGTGVIAGAFGAHGLKARVSPEDLLIFDTGVRYQMYHAVALLGLAALAGGRIAPSWAAWAGLAWTAGILFFSGSLYLLVLTNTRWLGAITPIGGVLMIVGWALLATAALRSGSQN